MPNSPNGFGEVQALALSPTMPTSTGTSATNPEASDHQHHYHPYYYLSGLQPTWDALQKGLAIFAVAIILRSCIHRVLSWVRAFQSRQTKAVPGAATLPADRSRQTVRKHTNTNINHFRPFPHHHLPRAPIPWMQGPRFPMDEKRNTNSPLSGGSGVPPMSFGAGEDLSQPLPIPNPSDQRWRSAGNGPGPLRYLIARPPPAPPLTPPELSSSIFTLEGRPYSQDSFIHQPNPDYASASSSTPSSGSRPGTSAHPRRFSYTKTIPIGVPIPHQPPTSVTAAAAAAATAAAASNRPSDLTFSPSSYPPSSPLLPPAPPTVSGTLGTGASAAAERGDRTEIDMHGQVVSVLDDEGAGWTRHTRVYGGGVCLACKAAGREHGDGGFYGATVTPEEMR